MQAEIRLFGIAGSLRQSSYNMAVLRTAQELLPQHTTLDIFDRLSEIPPFNQDQEKNPPEVVVDLKQKIRSADAIIFATPEYNYSIPGVLKNAIDWASRPYGDSAWEGKPVGIMSASIANMGGVRAQLHLRQVFVFLNMIPLNRPEILIPQVQEKVDQQGKLTDEYTRGKIAEFLQALTVWIRTYHAKA